MRAIAGVRRTGVSRRRLLQAGLLPGAAALLGGCSELGSTLGSQTLTVRQLDELLARAFPFRRDFAGIVELTLQNPRLRLLPQENRLGTALDLLVVERITGQRLSGGIDLDYALRFDPVVGAIRLADVHVGTLDLEQLPPATRTLVARYAPRLVELLLSDVVLYRLSERRLALARQLGVGVRALRVLPDGLRIEMAPLEPPR